MLSDEESQDRLEDADSDEDGRVSWSEVLQDMYGSDSDDLSVDDKLVSDDKELFEAADTNQDGFLDKEEFKAYTHPEETPKMFPILLKQALDEKDTDQDGYINFQVLFKTPISQKMFIQSVLSILNHFSFLGIFRKSSQR